jgi:hypothetical protein
MLTEKDLEDVNRLFAEYKAICRGLQIKDFHIPLYDEKQQYLGIVFTKEEILDLLKAKKSTLKFYLHELGVKVD